MPSRKASTPGMGAYWLWPSRMAWATASTSAGSQSKSGKPCDRLMALCSLARRVITEKMLTPMSGSLEVTETAEVIIRFLPFLHAQAHRRPAAGYNPWHGLSLRLALHRSVVRHLRAPGTPGRHGLARPACR